MTFCKEAKPLVWVLAECLVLTENMQMPDEVKSKMDAMGYALKHEPGFRCGQLPNETSHQCGDCLEVENRCQYPPKAKSQTASAKASTEVPPLRKGGPQPGGD